MEPMTTGKAGILPAQPDSPYWSCHELCLMPGQIWISFKWQNIPGRIFVAGAK